MDLEHPMFVNLPLALTAFSDYPGNSTDRSVFAVIAQYANRRGVAWPTLRTVAAAIGKTAVEVCRSVHRLAEKGFLKISQALKKNDRHPRNVYKIARRFLRRQPDVMSSHYIAAKWKAMTRTSRIRASITPKSRHRCRKRRAPLPSREATRRQVRRRFAERSKRA